MNTFFKQPDEIIPISMDYADTINDTEALSSLTVKAYSMSGTDVTTTLVDSSSIDGTKGEAIIKAGTSGTKYKITFKATTDEGNVYEEDVFMRVLSV